MEKKQDNNGNNPEERSDTPELWDVESLKKHWLELIDSRISSSNTLLPVKRLRLQTEKEPVFKELFKRWPGLRMKDRVKAWQQLKQHLDLNIDRTLPECVQCGECCTMGSPTLVSGDLVHLQDDKIPWNQLIALRMGEPAHSPYTGETIYLEEERIKIREKPGTQECVFYESDTFLCTIYDNRPAQCRSQECWDPRPGLNLASAPLLNRRELFGDIDTLRTLIDEHDEKCSFRKIESAFEKLKETGGENIDEVIEILGYEEHFRTFIADNLKIPADTLDLIFGKSLVDFVELFGFQVENGPDGKRTLIPREAD